MRTTKSHLRYFDYLGNVLDAWGKTGGQQGDPLEMIMMMMRLLLFLQKQNLAFAVYLFGSVLSLPD